MPWQVTLVNMAMLAGVALLAHHPVAFLGIFLMFLGRAQAYEGYHDALLLEEALLVGFFLAGQVCWAPCSSGGCSPGSSRSLASRAR